tara:strand:+ start:1300 stop:1557 length:258 start_codon:yes stop_codon:yes gene_type:complete
MAKELEILKKKLLYRASYRGTKEMDLLLSAFVKSYINKFEDDELQELENFLKYDDETISNFYNFNIKTQNIEKNSISKIFKKFKI